MKHRKRENEKPTFENVHTFVQEVLLNYESKDKAINKLNEFENSLEEYGKNYTNYLKAYRDLTHLKEGLALEKERLLQKKM